jgi:hypothetical protein
VNLRLLRDVSRHLGRQLLLAAMLIPKAIRLREITLGMRSANILRVALHADLFGAENGAGSQSGFALFVGEARLAEEFVRVHFARDGVHDRTIGKAEIRGDIAADLLPIDDLERADLQIGADKILVDVIYHSAIGESVHTERISVVSGEAGIFQIAGQMDHEDHLLFVLGSQERLRRLLHEQHVRADLFAIRKDL